MSRSTRAARIEGVCYPSASEAARSLGMSVQTLIARITSPTAKWNEWRYDDDNPVTIRHQVRKSPRPKLWCMYQFVHEPSGRFYVGSTGDLVARIHTHKSYLRKGRHHCKDLQALFQLDPNEEHWKVNTVIATDQAQAQALEQAVLLDAGLIGRRLNTTTDVMAPIQYYNSQEGAKERQSEKAKRLWEVKKDSQTDALNRGRAARWQSERSKRAFSGGGNPHSRSVRVHGIAYDSVKLAMHATGIDEKRIRQQANAGVAGFEWLSPEPQRFKAIKVDGALYPSLKSAGEHTRYTLGYLRRIANAGQSPDIHWAETAKA